MPDETRDVVEEASVGGEAAGKPVGHEGTRVMVDERPAWTMSGALALLLALALLGLSTWGIIATAISDDAGLGVNGLLIFGCIVGYLLAFLMFTSLTIVAPGDTKVVQFFGRYIGSIRKQGLLLTIPLSSKKRVSVKVRNFETNELKVNDADGNPINIAAIVVWQVADTAKSVFAVEAYEDFVKVQAESALRHIATSHPYDFAEPGEESLRGSTDLVSGELAEEVAARIAIAGLEVVETRISSLAYAAEIAQAMLQRQQASAVLAARSKIVEGAVGMVEQALERLETDDIVSLDDERKAAM
ncbi:MAG: SPFH domain-containing protein, partial [Propionibacteriaceae bacterium]|nr:SPFH domain-containing protein [Propionibacteriaceae bacterium]